MARKPLPDHPEVLKILFEQVTQFLGAWEDIIIDVHMLMAEPPSDPERLRAHNRDGEWRLRRARTRLEQGGPSPSAFIEHLDFSASLGTQFDINGPEDMIRLEEWFNALSQKDAYRIPLAFIEMTRSLQSEILAKLAQPKKTVKIAVPSPTAVRDRWIYDECLKGTPWDKILAEIKSRGWAHLGSSTAARKAANRQAARDGRPILEPRR